MCLQGHGNTLMCLQGYGNTLMFLQGYGNTLISLHGHDNTLICLQGHGNTCTLISLQCLMCLLGHGSAWCVSAGAVLDARSHQSIAPRLSPAGSLPAAAGWRSLWSIDWGGAGGGVDCEGTGDVSATAGRRADLGHLLRQVHNEALKI